MKDTFNILKNGKKTLKAPTNRRKHRTSPKTDSANTTPQIYNVSNTTTQKVQHRNPPIYKKISQNLFKARRVHTQCMDILMTLKLDKIMLI